jgi:hypothetical protein
VRSDGDLAVLLRNSRLVFFVPLTAFGADRDALLAHLRARTSAGR